LSHLNELTQPRSDLDNYTRDGTAFDVNSAALSIELILNSSLASQTAPHST